MSDSSDLPDGCDERQPDAKSSDPLGQADALQLNNEVNLQDAIRSLTKRVDDLTKVTDALRRAGNAASVAFTPTRLDDVEPALRERQLALQSVPSSGARWERRLIVPIHPPKIGHFSSMFSAPLQEVVSDNIGLTFVATTSADRELFEAYVALAGPNIPVPYEIVSAVELCEALGFNQLRASLLEGSANATINIKKLLGLYYAVMLNTREVVCIDSDVLFLDHPSTVFIRAAANYASRRFFAAGSPIQITKDVVAECASYYSPDDALRLRAIMGLNRFSWFYDAPYYPLEDAEGFLAHIAFCHGGVEAALCRLNWHTFDHVLFINYLLLRGLAEIVDISGIVAPGVVSDGLAVHEIIAVRDKHDGALPVWAPLPSLLIEPELAREAGFLVALHVDRAAG